MYIFEFMINRQLHTKIIHLLDHFPAVAILGPRQIGKTTLAKQIAQKLKKPTLYLDVEKPSDALKLQDAEAYLSLHQDKCVIIDEVQYMPKLYNVLRSLIDDYKKPMRFILTGSASPNLIKGISESLAGRIAYTELNPIGLQELPRNIARTKHFFYGGFPTPLTLKDSERSIEWLDYFIKSYIERDLSMLYDVQINSKIVRNFWQMLANNNASLWNAETYARALGITAPTVNRYLDFLEGAYLVRRLQPWHANNNKRLVKSPKVYLRDSGLLHRLADVYNLEELYGNVLLGSSWEGYAIEQIVATLPSNIKPYFYRTHSGAEIDLVLTKQNKPYMAIEIKLNSLNKPKKGFYEAIKDLKPTKSLVISRDSETYINNDGIICTSLYHFINIENQKLYF
jgi:predicted AAA+ superfamily ATPase